MKSKKPGRGTSKVEILNVGPVGIWILVENKEYFLDRHHFPWFQHATLSSIYHVQLLNPHHLYWPELDIDLEMDSLINPEKYPLISQELPRVPGTGGEGI